MIGNGKIKEIDLKISRNDGSESTLPLSIIHDNVGQCFIEMKSIKENIMIYDNGYTKIASCKSAISHIDGEKGILLYRGKKIEDVAVEMSLIEAMFFVIYGKEPNQNEVDSFLSKFKNIYFNYDWKNIENLTKNFDKKSHPMSIIMTIFSYLSSQKSKTSLNLNAEKIEDELIFSIVAMFRATIISYRHINGLNFEQTSDKDDLDITSIFMQDLLNTKNVNKEQIAVMEKMLILHLEHGQNASTSSVRNTTSTGVGLCAAISSGIASLWGPLHGGANEAVIKMLNEIGDIKNIDKYIDEVKNGVDDKKLMGFGHRIYKNYDPRAAVIKKYCDDWLSSHSGTEQENLLNTATTIEKKVLQDDYFSSRKLFPNVDFYSGITYQSLNIPTEMFVVMFALARITGWVAHWREMVLEGDIKIARPQQVYVGKV